MLNVLSNTKLRISNYDQDDNLYQLTHPTLWLNTLKLFKVQL